VYFKNIYFENVGPIAELNLEFPFENENPKPLVLIGQNGCGKSIFLSFLVNFLISAKQTFYENVEVEKDKVFKLRSPSYIHYGKHYYKAKILLDNNIGYEEWVLSQDKSNFEENLKYTIADRKWENIPENENDLLFFSYQNNNSQLIELRKFVDHNISLYFPPNRYEDPAWLNIHNLKHEASVVVSSNIKGLTDRNIICTNMLGKLTNWLFDIVYDSRVFEVTNISVNMPTSSLRQKRFRILLRNKYQTQRNQKF
jgi:energy-coupling factor transporter ATP-binding protein EcfA2